MTHCARLALMTAMVAIGCRHQAPATIEPAVPVLLIPHPGSPVGTIQGLVVSDVPNQVPNGAVIELPDLKRRTYANAVGAFQFTDVPSGEHQLTVRQIGYNPVSAGIIVLRGYHGAAMRVTLTASRACFDYCEPEPAKPPGRVESMP